MPRPSPEPVAWPPIAASYQRVAVFAHGGVLISAGIYAGLFEPDKAWDNQPGYGGIMTIEN